MGSKSHKAIFPLYGEELKTPRERRTYTFNQNLTWYCCVLEEVGHPSLTEHLSKTGQDRQSKNVHLSTACAVWTKAWIMEWNQIRWSMSLTEHICMSREKIVPQEFAFVIRLCRVNKRSINNWWIVIRKVSAVLKLEIKIAAPTSHCNRSRGRIVLHIGKTGEHKGRAGKVRTCICHQPQACSASKRATFQCL